MKLIYEDDLPPTMTDSEYDAWFAQSRVVDGVRMGPELDYSDWLVCPICGEANAFKIRPINPATGYCRVEDAWWEIELGA